LLKAYAKQTIERPALHLYIIDKANIQTRYTFSFQQIYIIIFGAEDPFNFHLQCLLFCNVS